MPPRGSKMLKFTKIGLELAAMLIWMGFTMFRVSPVIVSTTYIW